jgi:hypothetical protein
MRRRWGQPQVECAAAGESSLPGVLGRSPEGTFEWPQEFENCHKVDVYRRTVPGRSVPVVCAGRRPAEFGHEATFTALSRIAVSRL